MFLLTVKKEMMNKDKDIIVETIYEHGTTVPELCKYINVEIPWIWIMKHFPNETIEWWETSIPMNTKKIIINANVRNVN